MKISKSNKILICLLMSLFVFAVCLGTQVAISQTENGLDGNSVDELISKYEREAWENYTRTVEQYGVNPSVTDWNQALNPDWRNTETSIDQPSGQPQVDSRQVSFVNSLVELGVFSLSGLSLLVLLAIPKFGKKLLKRKLLLCLIFVAFVAYGAFIAYKTVAQPSGTDIPATATYVIKTDGVNVWATRYDGEIDFSGTNATKVIQGAIDACRWRGGGIVFIKAGTYNLNSTLGLYVGENVKLIGEGYGNTILKSIGSADVGVALCSDYSEVRDLTLQGNGDASGVANFWGPNDCKVLNCRITNWANGIFFGLAGTKHEFRGNIVENCGIGIFIMKGSDYIISNNIISETNSHGIMLYDSQNVVVAQNTVKNWAKTYNACAIGTYSYKGYCENINIIGNTITGGYSSADYYSGIVLSGENNASCFVRGCSVTGNTLIGVLADLTTGIYLHTSSVSNVEDCVISSNSIKNFNVGIISTGGKNIAIAGNIAVENKLHGIWLSSARHHNVIGNTVKNNGQGGQGMTGDGIYLDGHDCLISGNICMDDQTPPTQKYGIEEDPCSTNNFITGNLVKGNRDGGIAKAGAHTVVTNNLGNVIPAAAFTFSPAAPDTADTVQFTDQSTDLDGAIASWSWSFGDTGTSTVQNPTHQYLTAGTYTVNLTVTDNVGDTDSCSQSITVTPAPSYTLTISVNPSGAGTTDPSVGTHIYVEGTQVTITATASSGYVFDKWSGDASGSSPTIVVTMNSNKNVVANFKALYTFNSGAGVNKWAWYVDSNNAPPTSVNSATQLTTQYSQISASDNTRYTTLNPGSGDYASLKCEFIINENPGSVTEIKIAWEGYPSTAASDVTIWVWNNRTGIWDAKATVNCPTGSDTTITATITAGISDYINANRHIIFCVQNRVSYRTLTTDYVKLEITSS